MDHWLELRTAYRLAELGTVSAAAEDLGVHRATVNRHVDAIETAFGAKFFQRHARGYTLTEAGRDLLDVASRVDELITAFDMTRVPGKRPSTPRPKPRGCGTPAR